MNVTAPPPFDRGIHGHGGTAHDLAGLRVPFLQKARIKWKLRDCPCHTEINANFRILNEITEKLVTLNIKNYDEF
jgi:hypothetical protein